MKASFNDPRLVCLSWEPPASAGAELQAWIERFKTRLRALKRDKQNRPLELLDTRDAGLDRARLREGSWTDFMVLCTVDYCIAHDERGDASELQTALRLHADTGLAMWLLRMEPGDSDYFQVGDAPLQREGVAWSVLPAPDPAPPLVTTPVSAIDPDMLRHVLEPLRAGPGQVG